MIPIRKKSKSDPERKVSASLSDFTTLKLKRELWMAFSCAKF